MTLQINGRNLNLSKRETQVLKLIAEGCTNQQIADELRISIKTVQKHRQQVMDKSGLHCIALLTHFAISRGLVLNAFAGGVAQ